MKNKFIIISREVNTNYTGIDACGDECSMVAWADLDTWNKENPTRSIVLEDNVLIYQTENNACLRAYYAWLKRRGTSKNTKLLYFEIVDTTVVDDFSMEAFGFLGYDCVYIENDYAESILFSTVYNEMKEGTSVFECSLNENGLFPDLSIAGQYLSYREHLNPEIQNIETAYEGVKLDLVAVFCFEDE
ncbi:hypothetical protein [Chitinophaga nivalis]|uniref:Uncharacterized protein n=1 Tax=Chitinophaga nivalis TaxID=2991709 RepID=A0ABT3IRM7_9BACT|nr:hypothetical protein [Chitinophaga nivalis]MCW3463687.1 hypothetical protein [Chitinophaga nivalis]MCW3486623.1 hypothetical protein [Chitinophaga nivalis]